MKLSKIQCVATVARATRVAQEVIVIDLNRIPEGDRDDIHEHLVREKWFREHPSTETAHQSLGEGHVTYRRWK